MSGLLTGIAQLGCSPERVALLERVQDVLAAVGFTDIETEVENVYFSGQEVETHVLIEMVDNLFHGYLDSSLKQQGVFTRDDASMEQKMVLLEDLQRFANFDSPQFFIEQLDLDASDTERLCAALEIVGQWVADQYLEFIIHVNKGLLDRIRSFTSEVVSVESSDSVELSRGRLRIRSFTHAFGSNLVAELIREGYACGNEYTLYLQQLRELLPQQTDQDLAKNMVAIMMVSGLPKEALLATAIEEIEHMDLSLMRVSAINGLISKTYGDFINAQA